MEEAGAPPRASQSWRRTMSMIGRKEPEWRGTAYHKGEQKQIGNKDYAGKWHVLYWYPLDFTFVCPTEIRGFQEHLNDFSDDKIDVIGVSTDSFYSHKAWFADRKTFRSEERRVGKECRSWWV